MEKIKCSLKDHLGIEAITFCQECQIYMCNKCEKIHAGLCQNHSVYNLDKDIKDIFTGFCKEDKHNNELEFFCKTHNQLCCAKCIIKIKRKGNGQHTNCDIYNIEDIQEEKKNQLKDNIIILEELSNKLEESIKDLKLIFEKMAESKENIKLKIQKIFTRIRTVLNEREDELLLEVDNSFINENIFKDREKLTSKIKLSLDKGKKIENEWKDNKLSFLINDCIDIENNIKELTQINKKCKNFKNFNSSKIKLDIEKEEVVINFLKQIKEFGCIYKFGGFRFRECPKNVINSRRYIISGENNNIMTKVGSSGSFSGAICQIELLNSQIYKWKIKILKTKDYHIYIGIVNTDFDNNSPLPDKCGWYYYCQNSSLRSGPPYYYNGKETNLKNKKDEIVIIMDTEKRTLKFIIDNEDKGDSYTDIPIDKPIFPVVLLYENNDSVEITEY